MAASLTVKFANVNKALIIQTLNLPSPKPLPSRTVPVSYVLVADEAFALNQNVLKPLNTRNLNAIQRVFNCRLHAAQYIMQIL